MQTFTIVPTSHSKAQSALHLQHAQIQSQDHRSLLYTFQAYRLRSALHLWTPAHPDRTCPDLSAAFETAADLATEQTHNGIDAGKLLPSMQRPL